ncbi:MAG: YCF48-related protein [Bacteroidia bacterium]
MSVELPGCFLVNDTIAFAVGFSGTILKTIDGGNNWFAQTSPITNDLRSVYFTSADTGYIAGIGGVILSTTNGGNTWNTLTSGITNDLYSIFFSDNQNATVVGTAKILRTINTGSAWINQPVSFTGDLYSVSFADNNNGWTVGQNGKIFHTTNGGGVTDIEEKNSTKNNRTHIVEIFPNPAFNKNITPTFYVAQKDKITLEIYNSEGKAVQMVLSKTFFPGTYTTEIITKQLKPGNYFLKISDGRSTDSKWFSIIK